jgi:uncharacterized membrane-anchored protein
MKGKYLLGFVAVVVAQLLLLLGMIGFNENTLRTGASVVLQTTPIDPRSLFQGDYVVLGYQIGILPDNWPERPLRGDTVYVTLAEGVEVWQAQSYWLMPPPVDGVFIKGTVGSNCRLDFGIGTYYVPEGTGHIIEQAMFSGDPMAVKVRAAVDRNGNAAIQELLVNGKPFDSTAGPEPVPTPFERAVPPPPPEGAPTQAPRPAPPQSAPFQRTC